MPNEVPYRVVVELIVRADSAKEAIDMVMRDVRRNLWTWPATALGAEPCRTELIDGRADGSPAG